MINRSRELIHFDAARTGQKENFSGKFSSVDGSMQKEYLERYAKTLKKQYSLGELPEKVVGDQEVKALVEKYGFCDKNNAQTFYIDEMQAFEKSTPSPYKGWQFYTFGCNVKDGVVCFSDGITPPIPAAKYEFNGNERMQEISFSFKQEKFFRKQRVGITNLRGRFFELRSGISTVFKMNLLADGQLYVLNGSKDFMHPTYTLLGTAKENEWNSLRIKLSADSAYISFCGEETEVPLYNGLNPDTFFAFGGMHPMGKWQVRLENLKFKNKEITCFFEPQEKIAEEETPLGSVKLPFAIGTHKHKDKTLVLRKKFDYNGAKYAKLTLKSIDPCGYAYINGNLVVTANDFLTKSIDIAKYLKEKDNLLEIVVLPRAPEVLYQWHRHSDPYNGWFFRGGFIEFYNENYAKDLFVKTEEIFEGKAKVTLGASICGSGLARFYLKKVYPVEELEKEIDCFAYFGSESFSKSYELNVDAWSPETPNVYEYIVRLIKEDGEVFEKKLETGFRTIEQRDGKIFLNGERILLNGALSMQFLPPYENIPVNHLCPSDEQIVTELEQIKRMNGNVLRIHFLGYGTNDERFARYADRIGCFLIWTTRLIDGIETTYVYDEWRMAEAFAEQIKEVRQYPSIIMWEGSNEARVEHDVIDKMYNQFVDAVKSVDATRLICPCSHLYYGGGIYDNGPEIGYYQDDGNSDENFLPANASYGWRDKSVVRTSHTYVLLLGYGAEWEDYTTQKWSSQPSLLESKEHAYLVTEYAIIGRANPNVPEAKEYFNPNSYELPNEKVLKFKLSNDEYELSQAHQALCALYANKKMRSLDVDGMMWCCLQSGANDGSYLKPIIDFYGYAKFAFYILKDYYRNGYCVIDCDGPFWNTESVIRPLLISNEGKYFVTVSVEDLDGNKIFKKDYRVNATAWQTPLEVCEWKPEKAGYYIIQTEVEKL